MNSCFNDVRPTTRAASSAVVREELKVRVYHLEPLQPRKRAIRHHRQPVRNLPRATSPRGAYSSSARTPAAASASTQPQKYRRTHPRRQLCPRDLPRPPHPTRSSALVRITRSAARADGGGGHPTASIHAARLDPRLHPRRPRFLPARPLPIFPPILLSRYRRARWIASDTSGNTRSGPAATARWVSCRSGTTPRSSTSSGAGAPIGGC